MDGTLNPTLHFGTPLEILCAFIAFGGLLTDLIMVILCVNGYYFTIKKRTGMISVCLVTGSGLAQVLNIVIMYTEISKFWTVVFYVFVASHRLAGSLALLNVLKLNSASEKYFTVKRLQNLQRNSLVYFVIFLLPTIVHFAYLQVQAPPLLTGVIYF